MSNVERVLQSVVNSKYVTSDENICITYVRDAGIYESLQPEIVIRPGSPEEISRIFRVANLARMPIIVRGGGSNYAGAGISLEGGGILLETTRLNSVVEVDEESNSVTVQGGANWGMLNYELKKRGLQTSMKGSASGLTATIGGAASMGSTMWGAAKYGSIGDQILGMRIVLPTGEIINTGSGASLYAKKFTRYSFGPDFTGIFMSGGVRIASRFLKLLACH